MLINFGAFFQWLCAQSYTVVLKATFWNMNSSVRAVLVVWPGKAAVDLIEFQLPHSTLTNAANTSEFFYIEYKEIEQLYLCCY